MHRSSAFMKRHLFAFFFFSHFSLPEILGADDCHQLKPEVSGVHAAGCRCTILACCYLGGLSSLVMDRSLWQCKLGLILGGRSMLMASGNNCGVPPELTLAGTPFFLCIAMRKTCGHSRKQEGLCREVKEQGTEPPCPFPACCNSSPCSSSVWQLGQVPPACSHLPNALQRLRSLQTYLHLTGLALPSSLRLFNFCRM